MLFIKNLSLRNFRNIKKADFEFSKINLIEGETGEGKSAIFQALSLLFCNYLEGKIEEWINWDSDKFNISCEFNYKNIDYKYLIEATQKGNTNRKLTFGKEEYNKSDAYKYLAQNVLDPHLTLYSSISEQGKTASILFESPTKSLETLKKIFKVDVINDKVDLMKANIKELDEDVKVLKAEKLIFENKQFNYNELPELPNIDLKKVEEKISQLEKDKVEYNNQYFKFKLYEESYKKYNELQLNKVELTAEIELLKESKEGIEKRLLDEIEFDHNEYLNLSTLLIELQSKVKESKENKKRIDAIEIKINKIKKELGKYVEQLNENKIERLERCKYTQSNIDSISNEISVKSADIEFLKKKKEAVKEGKCPTCGNENFVDDVEKVQEDISFLMHDLIKLRETKINIETEIKNYENKVNDNKLIQSKITNIQENLKNKNEELNDLTIQKNSLYYNKEDEEQIINEIKLNEIKKLSLEELKDNFETIKSQNDIIRKKLKEIDTLTNKKCVLLESINEVEKPIEFKITVVFNEDEYEKLLSNIRNYKNIEVRIEELSRLNKVVDEQRNQNYIEIEQKLNAIVEKQKQSQILNEAQKILNKEFSSYLIDRKTSYINYKMDEFFQRAYNGKYRIKFEQSENKIGFYYSMDNENWHSTITLSGFERQLFSISFRIALSSIQNLGLLLVDEVDSDASTQKSIALYENILHEEKLSQTFAITHNDSTKEYIANMPNAKVFIIENGNLVN